MNSLQTLLIISFLTFNITFTFSQQPVPPVPLPPAEEEIFKVVEEMPRFPGCEHLDDNSREKDDCAKGKMLDYIYENLIYPEDAKEKNVEGMAVIQFTIWKDSSIRNVKIKRNPGSGTGEEAARIVESMMDMDMKWRPGYQRGRPVSVQYVLPVKFKIEGYDSPQSNKTSGFSDIVHIANVHEDPIFPDCHKRKNSTCTSDKLQEFIKENQLYPEKALKNETEGIVNISFVIELDGSLSNIKARKTLPNGLSEDAVEIFEWMNSEDMKWTPGKKNYKAVRTRYYVDVAYDIEGWKSRN